MVHSSAIPFVVAVDIVCRSACSAILVAAAIFCGDPGDLEGKDGVGGDRDRVRGHPGGLLSGELLL